MAEPLHIRVLGGLEVTRGGRDLALPPSKKARALLAYLAVTGRPHTRERLCDLLWDVADDPRAALRWCLSKLRPALDDGKVRLEATRTHVAVDLSDVVLDLTELRVMASARLEQASRLELERMLNSIRGEFLEGLDLPEFSTFHAWRIAHREELRRLHLNVVTVLLDRAGASPDRALPLARSLVDLDPQDGAARALLLEMLHASGRYGEAEAEAQQTRRLLADVAKEARGETPGESVAPRRRSMDARPFVGRDRELAELEGAVFDGPDGSSFVILSGPSGSGKSRLLAELTGRAAARGTLLVSGRAREERAFEPYAPWAEILAALGAGSQAFDDVAGGQALGTDAQRETRFTLVVQALEARAPLVLVIDDAHWIDGEAALLCEHVIHHAPRGLRLVLAGRAAALADNMQAARLVRALRRSGRTSELTLGPLSHEDARALARVLRADDDDVDRIAAEAGGNPLLLLELARAPRERLGEVPSTVEQLVRDRLATLTPRDADALRWAAVLGASFDATLLERVLDLSSEEFVSTLERLEKEEWVSLGARGAHVFAHDVVRRAVYEGLSGPRRRLMHRRVASLLTRDTDDGTLAHHAYLGGDAEGAARACLRAMQRCLRLGATVDAVALARRGVTYANELADPDRTTLLLDFHPPAVVWAKLGGREALLVTLGELTERALDLGAIEHARLGYLSRSALLWESGSLLDVRRLSLEVERISRAGGPRDRALALGDAAHCLAIIETDLAMAEALVLEGEALARREGVQSYKIPVTRGILALHRGELEDAGELFVVARDLARLQGERLAEFHILELAFDVELARADATAAAAIAAEASRLVPRIREGSEAAMAMALVALADRMRGEQRDAEVSAALGELGLADAKQRCAYVAGRAALLDLAAGRRESAVGNARSALGLATAIGRASEIAVARAVLVHAGADGPEHLEALDLSRISAFARRAIRDALAAVSSSTLEKWSLPWSA